jgi:GMP synthase (glutamine-hydrolysing)
MTMPTRRALVLSHVAFEDLGTLEPALRERGFVIETVDVATARFPLLRAEICDLLVVMGGPISVYDQKEYPFLTNEITCIAARLRARKPILGICLGAQLMASALGAEVYPGENGVEIGWSPLEPASGQILSPPEWFAPLLRTGLPVFHWHGDTFALPKRAVRLVKSKLYINQAFSIDEFALGLQFHPEVTVNGLENWYVGHACELRHAGISVEQLRTEARRFAPALQEAAMEFWFLWLDSVFMFSKSTPG